MSFECPASSSWQVEAAAERGGAAGLYVLSGDLAAFDLGDTALADTHAIGDLLLGEPAGAPDFGETVSDDLGQQLALTGLDHGFAPARATCSARMSFQATRPPATLLSLLVGAFTACGR